MGPFIHIIDKLIVKSCRISPQFVCNGILSCKSNMAFQTETHTVTSPRCYFYRHTWVIFFFFSIVFSSPLLSFSLFYNCHYYHHHLTTHIQKSRHLTTDSIYITHTHIHIQAHIHVIIKFDAHIMKYNSKSYSSLSYILINTLYYLVSDGPNMYISKLLSFLPTIYISYIYIRLCHRKWILIKTNCHLVSVCNAY